VREPNDLDLDRATDAARYAVSRGIPVMVDFNRRFDRDYAEVKRAVNTGEVGDVELIQLTSRGPAMPPLEYIAVSGGQMRDQTVHFFDLARWISGLDPVEVYATGTALAEPVLPISATSTPPSSRSDFPRERSSKSTAPGASATATTNGWRCSARRE
jgi:myo-inositol 2-dehydrogenase / D-chiro-inositol 1-dehydrogenase